MKITAYLLILFFSSSVLYAQEAEGYYITNAGDTIRGKIKIPVSKNVLVVGSSSTPVGDGFTLNKTDPDPLAISTINESNNIDFQELTFEFMFSKEGEKFKKIDRLNTKGFTFFFGDKQYDFETWDASANKQLYLMPSYAGVESSGIYFILKTIDGYFPIYSLFQQVELQRKTWNKETGPGVPIVKEEHLRYATRRDIIFKHPTKGFIYISNRYPLKMKHAEALKYLELESEFISTLNKKEPLYSVIQKYNIWKSK